MSAGRYGGMPRHPNDVTPQWLTARLRESGALPSGSVTSLDVDPVEKSLTAQTARLTIGYDLKTAPGAPRGLFMKFAEPDDRLADMTRREVEFYSQKLPAGLPLARCYFAACEGQTGATCILLEELGGTHCQTPWPLPPSLSMCEAAVATLARLHAFWWNSRPSETGTSGLPSRRKHHEFAGHIEHLLPRFLDFLGDRLPQDRRDLMRKVCDRLPALLWDRVSGGRPITLVHGDAHFWNVMLPKDPARHGCVFVDWQAWRRDVGAFDLAYMIALHWYRDRRARHEEHLLRTYHEALRQEISTDYGWGELLADYRLGHLRNFVVPLFQLQMDLFPGIWWSHLERLFLAFEDLDCAELL